MILGCSLPTITRDYAHTFENYKDILKFIVCDENENTLSPKCHFGKCRNCPGIEKLKEYLTKVFEDKEIAEISYSQWIPTPVTTLKNLVDDASDFIPLFCEQIEKLLPHAFIARQQSSYFKALKDTIQNDEVVINLDFAENYAFIVQDAPPGFHWNNNQATVFVAFFYHRDGNETKNKGFVVISDNLNHDTVAVYTYQQLLIEYLKNQFPSIRKVHYFSDGAPQQFKNFKNILNIYYHSADFEMESDWHFFPTAHGKGACDGVGGSVKRTAAKASLRLPPEAQILTALSLYNWLKKHGNFKNVEFAFSEISKYNKNARKLNSRFKNKSRVVDLQKQHFIAPMTNGKVQCKTFSNNPESIEMKIID